MNPETNLTQKQEAPQSTQVEATRAQATFLPCTDIYERENELIVIAQMPGVSRDAADVSLEEGELRIAGHVERSAIDGHQLAYSEYEAGDYQRTFRITGQIDVDKIDATMKNGVLRIVLPKSKEAAPQKISIKAG
ncbi:MAG: Hsp20/alpha crystallin family protein [Solirubrobacterales bacterium]